MAEVLQELLKKLVLKMSIQSEFQEHIELAQQTNLILSESISNVANECLSAISGGGKIILFGNGGSASDAQHIAAEFVGRYKKERNGLPAISLSTDTSALTAIGNDYGFERIFERQIQALGAPQDLAIAISTSGNSPNVLRGIRYAKTIGMKVIGFSGRDGGDMRNHCDLNLVVPSQITARIQEMHILIGHIICQIIDDGIES